jgi:predicted AAA+ superfamily ATPase
LFIDKVQRAGDDFVIAIKAAVDRDQRPDTFVLSGSTRFLTVPTLSESLAGRAALIELWPFSVAERVGVAPEFLDRVFGDPGALLVESPAVLTRHEYLRLACIGSYLMTVTQREVLDIVRVRNIELLPRMFRLLAALTAQELNAAPSPAISESTTRRSAATSLCWRRSSWYTGCQRGFGI